MVSSPTIPPGGEGKIEVKLNTKGRAGKLNKTISVYSNDPKQKRFTLSMKGEVEVMLGFDPQRVYLRMKRGDKETKKVKLIGKLVKEAKLSELKSNKPDQVKVKLVQVDGAPQLEVTVKAGKKDDRINALITAKTGLDKHPTLSLHVWANVTADIVTVPRRVYLRKGKGDKPIVQWLSIYSQGKKPFKVKKIVDPDGKVSIKLKKESDHRWRAELQIKKDIPEKGGKLKIHTNRADQKIIEVVYMKRAGLKMRRIPTPRVGGGVLGGRRGRQR